MKIVLVFFANQCCFIRDLFLYVFLDFIPFSSTLVYLFKRLCLQFIRSCSRSFRLLQSKLCVCAYLLLIIRDFVFFLYLRFFFFLMHVPNGNLCVLYCCYTILMCIVCMFNVVLLCAKHFFFFIQRFSFRFFFLLFFFVLFKTILFNCFALSLCMLCVSDSLFILDVWNYYYWHFFLFSFRFNTKYYY